jgi:hypothetical protein
MIIVVLFPSSDEEGLGAVDIIITNLTQPLLNQGEEKYRIPHTPCWRKGEL